MKKILRFAFLLCLLTVSFISFTACNVVSLNTQKDYNQVVIVAGDLKFTKQDLLNDYYGYGYQYIQSKGSVKGAIQETARTMVKRGLLFEEIKKIIDITNYKGENHTNDIIYHAYQAMQQSFERYEEEVRKEWYNETSTDNQEDQPLRPAKQEYKPKVKYENGELVRVVEPHGHDNLDEMPDSFEIYNKQFLSNDEALNAEAWTRYIRSLQVVAQREGRPTDRQVVLEYEQERLIKVYTNNKYMDLYQQHLLETAPINAQDVVEYFKKEYITQHTLFTGLEDSSAYDEAMVRSLNDFVFYHDVGETRSKGYIYVSHVLIKFGDTPSSIIENLKTQYGIESEEQEAEELSKGESSAYYNDYVKMLQEVEVTFELDGEIQTASLLDVQQEILDSVNAVDKSDEDMKNRFQEFERLMYLYNDDDGSMNADFYYSVNLDTNVEDRMFARFASASRELAANYDKGDVYQGGPFDGLVITEYEPGKYGAHIVIHGGISENFIDINSIDNLTYEMLLKKYVNPASDKTLFHYFYDKLQMDESLFEQLSEAIVNTKMAQLDSVQYYERYYRDLWSQE